MMQRILVVEDDYVARSGVVELLSRAGFEASGLASVPSALAQLKANRPDLLITDVRVQGENGLQLVALFGRVLPAIVVTGFDDSGLEAEARAMGAEYLVKPVLPSTLVEMVSRKLAQGPPTFSPARRWPRKSPREGLAAQADSSPARVLDVSYGGVRFSVQRATTAWHPESVSLVLPGWQDPLDVQVVWRQRDPAGRWLCGGLIADGDQRRWRELVDQIPS
jgi:DNA-binding response OmpR family regulator